MDDFNKLKQLWQSQKKYSSRKSDIIKHYRPIVKKFKNFGRRLFWRNLLKTLFTAAALIFYVFILLTNKKTSFFLDLGLVWIITNTIVFMVIYWKKQPRIRDLNFDKPSTKFIESTLEKLYFHKKMIHLIFPVFGFLVILGINLVYLGLFQSIAADKRLTYHLVATFILMLAVLRGIKILEKRHKKHFLPLIQNLESYRSDLVESEVKLKNHQGVKDVIKKRDNRK